MIACLLLLIGFVQPQPPKPPGIVIAYSPAKTKVYLGSPSIVSHQNEYLVSHDEFGPGSTRDTTHVYASQDRGLTWKKRSTIKGQWWSGLFIHHGALYLMGTSKEYGHVVIRRSNDAGQTWTEPKDSKTGLLLNNGKYHTSAVPVVVHEGRLWRAMEDAEGPGKWGSHFRSFMMSAPLDADLLDSAAWTISNKMERNPAWLGNRMGGWLEGNAIVDKKGGLSILLRVDYRDKQEKAAIIDVSDDGKFAVFDPEKDFVNFPGGCKKFVVRHDPVSDRNWSLANAVPPEFQGNNPERTRNALALMSSDNLRDWKVHRTIMQAQDVKKHGFQYADWQFEGDDLIAVVRTAFDDAFDGAHNQHDSNYILFTRVKKFRDNP